MLILLFIIKLYLFEISWPMWEKNKLVKEIKNLENFFKNIKNDESLNILVLYSKSKCFNCLNFSEKFSTVSEYFKDYVNFYKFDCDSLLNIKFDKCTQTKPEEFPTIHFYFPELKIYYPYNPPQEKERFIKEFKSNNPKEMIFEIEKRLPFFIFNINSINELNNYLNLKRGLNKIIYFHNYNYIPNSIKGLSTIYKNKIDFAHVNFENNKEIFYHFKIKDQNLPKLMILNLEGNNYNKRFYKGIKSFENYSDFISVFTKKKIIDNYEENKDKIKNNKNKFELINDENWNEYMNVNEIVILHIFEPLSMRFSHLDFINKYYKGLVKLYDFIIDTPFKKQLLNNVFKNNKKIPYSIFLPEGNLYFKLKNFIFFDSLTDIDSMINTISKNISHNINEINILELQSYIDKSIFENKGLIVLFYDNDVMSMGFRKLSKIEYYKKYFNFASIKGEHQHQLNFFKINKIPKIVMFYPVYNNLKDEEKDYLIEYLLMDEIIQFITIKNFLENQINNRMRYITKLPFLKKNIELKENCLNKQEICFMLLLNMNYFIKENDELQEIYLILNKLRENFKNKLNFIWLNLNTNKELYNQFSLNNNIKSKIIFYNKNWFYKKIDYKSEYYSIKEQIEKEIENKNNLDYLKESYFKIRRDIFLNDFNLN